MASIYVGTYAKYNAGNLFGKWLDLDDYTDKDEFIEACKDLHKDEADPELMFQDYQGVPSGMVSESSVDEEVWEWLELSPQEQEIVAVYRDNVNQSGSFDEAKEAYQGEFSDEADWAANHWEESGMLSDVPEHARGYIDYESYARDQSHGGMSFVRHNGEVWAFRSDL